MKKSFILLSLLLLFSCSKEELPSSVPAPVKKAEKSSMTPEIDYQRAQSIAEKAPFMFGDVLTKGATKRILSSEIVSGGFATKSSGSDALMYIFNYAEGGYAVIPAVDINGEVVAYVEQGSLKMSDTLNNDLTRLLVKLMIDRQKRNVAEYENSKTVATKSIPPVYQTPETGPVCGMIGYSDDYGEPVAPPALAEKMGDEYYPMYGCARHNTSTVYTPAVAKAPMLKTTWGQGEPYNWKSPLIDGRNALTGSVSLALAQIMLYHSYPTYYPTLTNPNISKFSGVETYAKKLADYGKQILPTNSPAIKDYASRLLVVLGYLVNNNWGVTRTSAYTSAVPNAFAQMGYVKPSILPYSEYEVRKSLVADSPVYIGEITNTSGGCIHAWVIDGFKQMDWRVKLFIENFDEFGNYNGRLYYDYDLVGERTYYHCNFGFNGDSNGYYDAGVFDTSKPYESTGNNVNNGDFTPGTLHIITGVKK